MVVICKRDQVIKKVTTLENEIIMNNVHSYILYVHEDNYKTFDNKVRKNDIFVYYTLHSVAIEKENW